MNQLTGAMATSGPGRLVGGIVGYVIFDAFASSPPCESLPCTTVAPTLLGMGAPTFIISVAAIGALLGWVILFVQSERALST